MRGKHGTYGRKRQQRRITPADAGKTETFLYQAIKLQDHPRGCGENGKGVEEIAAFLGSPPRMRGKLSLRAVLIVVDRITPADAGKTNHRPNCNL